MLIPLYLQYESYFNSTNKNREIVLWDSNKFALFWIILKLASLSFKNRQINLFVLPLTIKWMLIRMITTISKLLNINRVKILHVFPAKNCCSSLRKLMTYFWGVSCCSLPMAISQLRSVKAAKSKSTVCFRDLAKLNLPMVVRF